MTTVLITGANGFIARHLAHALQRAGMRVVGVSRRGDALPGYDEVWTASLGDSLLPALAAAPVDAIVHTALATGADSYRLNAEGATRWLDEGRAAGVPLQLLLSTLSAGPDALSDYGRAKWTLETRFVEAGEVALRLGVVVGDGGMYARIRRSALGLPVTPLLDGGSQLLYLVGIDALCAVLAGVIETNGAGLRGRAWNLVQPEPVTLRTLVQAIQRDAGRPSRLVSAPSRLVLLPLRVAESLPWLRLPVTSTNVQGLIRQGQRRVEADWAHFGRPVASLEDLVRSATRN